MNIASTSPVSGMTAAQLRMDNVANNVANVNTRDFQPQRLQQTEVAPAPRDTFESTTGAAGQSRAVGAGTEVYAAGAERPDLARDMTDMTTQRNTYSANAQTARVQNDMLGTTIDLAG